MSTEPEKKVSLLIFFMLWARRMRWDVPYIHVQALMWLETKGSLAVLRCFRGFGTVSYTHLTLPTILLV